MSDRRLLGFVWLFLSLCLLLVFRDMTGWVFGISGVANPELLGGTVDGSDAIAVLLTIAVSVGAWKHPVAFQFSLETVEETRKVVWPTRKETRDHTIVVVIVSIIFALMLWGFDQVWKQFFGLILDMGA